MASARRRLAANQAMDPAVTKPQHGRHHRPAPRQGDGVVPLPLGPTFHHAAIGDADQGPVVEVPPQVVREHGRAGISPTGILRQGTRDDRGQSRADPMIRAPQSGGDPVLVRRPLAGQCDVQHHAQRVNVGPGVDGRGRPAIGQRHQRGELLRRDERGRAPDPPRARPAGSQRGIRQVEVEQQGQAVRRQQDVRRLHIPVDEIPQMRMMERLGQAQPDPGDRPFVRLLGEELPRGARGRERDPCRDRGPIQDREEFAPGPLRGGTARHSFQQVFQGRATQIGQADDPEAPFREVLRRQDRHDVRVLEPRQRSMLAPPQRASP